MNDELTLHVGGMEISGWTDVHVTCGIERVPRVFEIGLTERFPGELDEVIAAPGDACVVRIGGEAVVTGYVDRLHCEMSDQTHTVKITGRGKCQDLVDCAAEWPNGQISGSSAVTIATKLAGAYGIGVTCSEKGLPIIPQFNLMLGETAFEIIERVSRYSALLVYDGPDGNLILARSGSTQHASGIEEGANVQDASVEYSADQRFQTYKAFLQAINTFQEGGDGGNTIATVTDSGVKRNRKKFIISEAVAGLWDIAKRRATWEMNRRNGRSTVVKVTVDSWRDSAGELWTPNKLVSVYLPTLKLGPTHAPTFESSRVVWLISEVTYSLDENRGTTAELVIMAPEAFEVEPFALQPAFVNGAEVQGASART
ncbi:hypothetical protein BGV67_04535 [Burkholderia ubonensis]|uniref:phage baseplate assembly protein n=1 Tax=Burkholderia ubonensis TaxID=101571 RepID=UPI0009002159|nr:hypothetical protein [Burkholderia ubonensis]OJA74949.1 hypothetical protein BGV67_04535 [Burkholderia ubonensis]